MIRSLHFYYKVQSTLLVNLGADTLQSLCLHNWTDSKWKPLWIQRLKKDSYRFANKSKVEKIISFFFMFPYKASSHV